MLISDTFFNYYLTFIGLSGLFTLLCNYFIFQKTKLNKEVRNNWKLEEKGYTPETGVFKIRYKVIDSELSKYFNIDESRELNGRLGGTELSEKNLYKDILEVKNEKNNINYYETLTNSKEDEKNEK